MLTRLDPEAFATLLYDWLQAHAGALPQALALDGKMIRDHIGLLTLAQHEDGAPQAVAVYDQTEGTGRCEQTAARGLLENIPALDDKIVTADALHCQKPTARAIAEKGRRRRGHALRPTPTGSCFTFYLSALEMGSSFTLP